MRPVETVFPSASEAIDKGPAFQFDIAKSGFWFQLFQ